MKIRFYLALAAAALVMTNCSQDEELVQVKQNTKGFTATIEGASRSDVTEQGTFSWTAGDAISVYTEAGTFDTYANSEADVNTFVFAPIDEENAGTPTGYAIYPAGDGHKIDGETVTINLPENYDYGSTNAPMLATITEGSSTLAFNHLGGLMRFVVKGVPGGASSFVFTTTNDILTGNYSVIDGQIYKDGENEVNDNNSVTINFTKLTTATEMVFFVPLPVGTYGNYTVAIKGTGVDLFHSSTGVTNTIGRRTMLLMPEFSVENGELKKGAGNVIPVTQKKAANLSGIQNVTIGTDNATEEDVLDINYTPSEGNAVLNITDDSGKTESQETSKGKIKINPQGSEAIESLNLNTPSLTAELGAGKYGTVEALTAKQTLIIGEGVTITKLILNGGALQVAEGATIGEIIVKDEAGLNSAVAAGKATLGADIDLSSTLWIGSDCEIDLNGHYIKCANGTTIKVKSGKTLTIGGDEEGSLVESTLTNGAAISNLAGTLKIKSGTYQNISSVAPAIFCDRVNENGDRTGTWNLTIEGGTFIGQNFTAVSLQNNRKSENHADYADGKATISGGTFNGGGGYYDLYLANVIADITAGSFTNNRVYLLTQGAAIDGGEGTWSSLINESEISTGGLITISTNNN